MVKLLEWLNCADAASALGIDEFDSLSCPRLADPEKPGFGCPDCPVKKGESSDN